MTSEEDFGFQNVNKDKLRKKIKKMKTIKNRLKYTTLILIILIIPSFILYHFQSYETQTVYVNLFTVNCSKKFDDFCQLQNVTSNVMPANIIVHINFDIQIINSSFPNAIIFLLEINAINKEKLKWASSIVYYENVQVKNKIEPIIFNSKWKVAIEFLMHSYNEVLTLVKIDSAEVNMTVYYEPMNYLDVYTYNYIIGGFVVIALYILPIKYFENRIKIFQQIIRRENEKYRQSKQKPVKDESYGMHTWKIK